MADALEQLLAQQLLQEAGTNTATQVGSFFDQIGQTGLQMVANDARLPSNERRYSIGDAIGVGLISGLLGGGLGSIGASQRSDNLNAIASILSGVSDDADGLEPSLYKKTTTLRDLYAKNEKENLLRQANEIEKTLLTNRLDRAAQREEEQRALLPELGSSIVPTETKAKLSTPEDALTPSPYLSSIAEKVPSKMQGAAIAELGTLQTIEDAFRQIDIAVDSAAKNATTAGTYDPTGMVPSVSEAAKLYDTAKANITANVLKIWKGPLDQNDAKRIIEPYVPDINDTPTTIEAKKRGLKALLAGNAKETPTLEVYGIRTRPSVDAPLSPAIPSNPNADILRKRELFAKIRWAGGNLADAQKAWAAQESGSSGSW